MSILNQLSSQVGDRTETANRIVVAQCLARRALLREVAKGLVSQDAALVGDCVEVMTEVAEAHPDWVKPYAEALASLLTAEKTRVRWEATHSLAMIAPTSPKVISPLLPRLSKMIRSDPSVIVRDHAVDAVGNYAGTSPTGAREAYPVLVQALTAWEGKQAGHALNGLRNVAQELPLKASDIRARTQAYLNHPRGVVRKAAKSLLKTLDKL